MPFVKRANTHQTHWEDLVLLGPDGLEELDDKIEGTLEKIQDMSSDRMNITTKIDGSPALFCYHTYPGYPDNGIALKGFVNGPQNVMTSKEEIDQKYGDRATMKQMLYYGLELAKCIPDGECWQGDCLFTSDSKKEENILGKDYITFQPNKIIYAFSEDQPGYEEVKNAVFGICFHTIYSGENKSQTFKCNPTRLKNVPSNFYIMSPALNVNKESFNVDQIKAHIAKLSRLESQLLSNEGYATLVSNSKFMKDYWSTFENKVLADRQQTTINETTFINELKDYISEKLGKDIDKLKTDNSKAKARQKLADLLDLVENNKQVLTLLVKTLNEAANIKMLLWEGFRQAKSDYSTFYKSKTKGHFGADMEGIAVSDQDGNIVKIVDRSKFSSYNRDPDIESGWEHNESLSEAVIRRDFNKLIEEEEQVDPSKTLVFSFGKFNPPTIGHLKLAQTMANCNETSNKPVVYLSHRLGLDKNNPIKSQPLDYEEKLYWCKKAFGNLVEVVESNAKNPWEALHEINEKRPEIERIIFAGGDDRANGSMYSNLVKSNGKQTSKHTGDYNFIKGIVPLNAGARDESSDDVSETASSSLVRKCVLENDFDKFQKLVPFNEADAEDLFDEIKDFYKDSGILNENLLIEAISINSVIGDKLKNIIKQEFNKNKIEINFMQPNYARDPGEVLRIRAIDSSISKDILIKIVLDALNKLNNGNNLFDFNNESYIIYDYENFAEMHSEKASGTYDSIKLLVKKTDTSESSGAVEDFYITIAAKLAGNYKKAFTPNRVLDSSCIGEDIRFDSLKFNLSDNFKFLEAIYNSAIHSNNITNGDDPLSGYSIKVDNMNGVNKSNINDIMNDFGEVLSAGCLARLLGDPNTLNFPKHSNEPLTDFTVNGVIKVSQKAKSGATPSGDSVFNIINNNIINKNVNMKLFLPNYSNNDINELRSFIIWFSENVFSNKVNVHNGYKNIANLVISNNQPWLHLSNISKVKRYTEGTVNRNSWHNFMADIKSFGIDANPSDNKLNTENGFESYRCRYLARIVINYINNNDKLIGGLNKLLAACLGQFIQVYLVNPNEFMKGNLIFEVKKLDTNYNYKFYDASQINDQGFLYNKKLGMKLV